MESFFSQIRKNGIARKLLYNYRYYRLKLTKKEIILSKNDFQKNYLKDIENSDFLYAENLGEYLQLLKDNQAFYQKIEELKSKISKFKENETFYIEGFNTIIRENDLFRIEFTHMRNDEINFKEFCTSVKSRLNGRLRFTYDVISLILNKVGLKENEKSYIAEFDTPLYFLLKAKFKNKLVGSGYFGPNVKPGEIVNGVQHQDLEHLGFESNSFKYCLSFEDLEHVVNYKKAIAELYRVLASDGVLILSVPFNLKSPQIIERAYVDENGKICHILEPEIHGDPLNKDGILCFRHFGWEFLDELKNIGFKHVKLLTGPSPRKLIIGNLAVIVCSKEIPF